MSQQETIFAAIAAEILAENPTLLTADAIRFGGAETHRHHAPPEIVVTPSPDESWEAPEQIGGQTYLGASDQLTVSRCIYTVRAEWEVRLWGRTRDEAEALRQAFLLACLEEVGDVLRPLRGTWVTDNDDAGDVVDGAQYTLTCTLALSITDDPPEEAVSPPGMATTLDPTVPFVHTGGLVDSTEVGCGDT